MKILFLPSNIASVPSITANGLNKLEGIEAKCLTNFVHKYQSSNQSVLILPNRFVSRKNPFKWLYAQWNFKRQIKKWIAWADVLHYIWGPVYTNGKDLKWAKDLKKPIFIEWVGSDIRDPEILFKINPSYKWAFNNGFEYREFESSDHKIVVQHMFSEMGAKAIVGSEMSLFLNKTLFPEHIKLMQRLDLHEFLPYYPDPQKNKPLLIHSPSSKIAKGTNIITAVIEELKREMDFDFVLLHEISREQVLRKMKEADIFIDQIVYGGYGMAATEALAFGKPVLCYLLPQLFEAGLPGDCPIVNTNADNLKAQLIRLINNAQLRHDIGKQSRVYVEKYHDAEKISKQLVNTYKQAIAEKNRTNAETA